VTPDSPSTPPSDDQPTIGTPAPVAFYIQSTSVASGNTVQLSFPVSITKAFAFVSGFSLEYANGDHHVKAITVEATAVANKTANVSVSARCEMKDSSGNKATATIPVTVIALTE
jgi:hypothetical protein